MGFRFGTLLHLSAVALLLGGCGVGNTLISAATGAPPGLEGLYAERSAAEARAREDARLQAEAEAKNPDPRRQAFPAAFTSTDEAERHLYGDNVALRFLTVRTLAEDRIIPPDEAKRRRDVNLGALLPLTHGPSTLGLNGTIEPVATTRERLLILQQHYPVEAAFLLDEILPLAPLRTDTLTPRDTQAVTALNRRPAVLEDAGLITPAERLAESAALGTLMRSGTLYPNALALPPQEKARPPRGGSGSGTASGGRGARMPGGVSGGLVVISSPLGASPTLLPANATGPAGAYLLGVSAPNFGPVGWDGLVKEHPELKGLDWTLEKVTLGNEGATYRLIAGPMDPDKARTLCKVLEPRRQLCLPVAFPKNGIKPANVAPITKPSSTTQSAPPVETDPLSLIPATPTPALTPTPAPPPAPAPVAEPPTTSTPTPAPAAAPSGRPSPLSAPVPTKSENMVTGAPNGLIAPPPAPSPNP